MSKLRILLTVVSTYALLTGLAPKDRVAQAASAGGNEVFLTTAEQRAFGAGSDAENRWVPTKQKIGFAWSDQPFAIHVPFDAEIERDDEGTPWSKTYKAWLELDGLTFKRENGSESSFKIKLAQKGLYRFDGQPVSSSTGEFYFLERQESLRCPTRLPREGKLGYWLVYDPRRQSVGSSLFEYHDGIWKYFGEKIACKLKVEVHEVKALGEDRFGTPQYEKTKKANEQEFEFAIRQNGWRVKGFAHKNAGPWQGTRSSTNIGVTDLGGSARGTSLINPFRYVEQSQRKPAATTDFDFILQFSTPIWDISTVLLGPGSAGPSTNRTPVSACVNSCRTDTPSMRVVSPSRSSMPWTGQLNAVSISRRTNRDVRNTTTAILRLGPPAKENRNERSIRIGRPLAPSTHTGCSRSICASVSSRPTGPAL